MTWFSSGSTVGALGTALDDDGAIRGAFDATLGDLENLRADDITLPAVERAAARWAGDGATPFLARNSDERRESRLRLDIGGERVTADPAFAVFAVPPGADEVTITFLDDGRRSLVTAFTDQPPSRALLGGEDETYILVDAFVGGGTTRQTALARVTNGFASVRMRLSGRVAVLLGSSIRVAAESRAARDRDPSWRDRLDKLEREPAHRTLARKHPELRHATPGSAAIAAVLIHGTFSSCVPALADVTDLVETVPLYRFEHDTMRPVVENAQRLVNELEELGCLQATLLGHSRGGLVATWAAARLQIPVKVLTFGTPHNGTPIVGSLDNLLGYVVTAAGVQFKSTLDGGLVTAHLGSTLADGHLPDGWTDMLPHGSFIQTLSLVDRSPVTAYGGVFDGSNPELGTGPSFQSQVMQALMAGDNDLVVPIESSKPDNLPGEILDQVDHFSYFSNLTVKNAIKDALSSSPLPASSNPNGQSVIRPPRS